MWGGAGRDPREQQRLKDQRARARLPRPGRLRLIAAEMAQVRGVRACMQWWKRLLGPALLRAQSY